MFYIVPLMVLVAVVSTYKYGGLHLEGVLGFIYS